MNLACINLFIDEQRANNALTEDVRQYVEDVSIIDVGDPHYKACKAQLEQTMMATREIYNGSIGWQAQELSWLSTRSGYRSTSKKLEERKLEKESRRAEGKEKI